MSAATVEKPSLLADYASEEETAAELDVSTRTLARWRAMRVGPPPTAVGRKWYYKRSSFAAWLDRQERAPEALARTPRRPRA
jgi:hypothetical protein